jgi:metal-sulfur cluster biosynthetic enzyme
MTITQDMVFEKLKNVIDPELFVNIVDLGLIYEIDIDQAAATSEPAASVQVETAADAAETATDDSCTDSKPAGGAGERVKVHIDMTMTSPACPAGPALISGAKREVGSIEGVGEVDVKIVLDPPWTPDRMTEDAKDQLGIF